MGSEAFPKDFPMFFPDLSKIYEGNHQKSDQISDRMLDFAELFGTVRNCRFGSFGSWDGF